MGALVEQVQVELAERVGGGRRGARHRVPGAAARAVASRRRTSARQHVRGRRRNRRRHVVGSTCPGTLCGSVSPTRSSRSASDEVGVARRQPLEGGVEQRRPAPSPTGRPRRRRAAAGTARRHRRRRRRTAAANAGMSWVRTPATAAGRDRRPACSSSVEAELLLVHPERRPSGPAPSRDLRRAPCRGPRRRSWCRRRRLGGDHGQQLVAGVADVHAVGRARALGDPPQPLHAHHVVDAQHRGVLAGAGDEPPPQPCPLRRPAPGSCGGNPQSWPSAKNSSGGAPTVIPVANSSRVGPRLVAGRVAADRQVEGERGPARRPRRRPSWRWARYWASTWLRSTSAAGRPASTGSGRAARKRA